MRERERERERESYRVLACWISASSAFKESLNEDFPMANYIFPEKKFPSNKQKNRNVTTLKSEKRYTNTSSFRWIPPRKNKTRTLLSPYYSLIYISLQGGGFFLNYKFTLKCLFFLYYYYFFDRITRLKLTIKFWIRLLSGVLVDNLTSFI